MGEDRRAVLRRAGRTDRADDRVLVDERKWIGEQQFLHALNFCMLRSRRVPKPCSLRPMSAGGSTAPWADLLLAFSSSCRCLRRARAQHRLCAFRSGAARPGGVRRHQGRRARHRHRGFAQSGKARASRAAHGSSPARPLSPSSSSMCRFPWRLLELPWRGLCPCRHESHSAAGSLKARSLPFCWPTLRTVSLWSAIWILPLALLAVIFGRDHVFTDIAIFFSKLAIVTFGCSVLTYMAQQADLWLAQCRRRRGLDGLGLAETTPGPLILVTRMARGYRYGGDRSGRRSHCWRPSRRASSGSSPARPISSASAQTLGLRAREAPSPPRWSASISIKPVVCVALAKVERGAPLRLSPPDLSTLDIRPSAFSPRGASATQVETRHRCHARDFRGRGPRWLRRRLERPVLVARSPEVHERAEPTCRDGPNRPSERRRDPGAAPGIHLGGAPDVGSSSSIISGAGLLHERGAG